MLGGAGALALGFCAFFFAAKIGLIPNPQSQRIRAVCDGFPKGVGFASFLPRMKNAGASLFLLTDEGGHIFTFDLAHGDESSWEAFERHAAASREGHANAAAHFWPNMLAACEIHFVGGVVEANQFVNWD